MLTPAISYTDSGKELEVEWYDSEFCLYRGRRCLVTEHEFIKLSGTVLKRDSMTARLELRDAAPAGAECAMCERPINERNDNGSNV